MPGSSNATALIFRKDNYFLQIPVHYSITDKASHADNFVFYQNNYIIMIEIRYRKECRTDTYRVRYRVHHWVQNIYYINKLSGPTSF